ncbi:exopolysaccharide biosynthesis protein [Candidatus Saccharibacteria bacterium]|nr:exopolysaccharide biosynthesis protein [Candidatus Saccharibacteria bacterium]MBI3338368.1 exopolysaccharide biosynthesis protein [Candidatus Saccharibacteria bacterium]
MSSTPKKLPSIGSKQLFSQQFKEWLDNNDKKTLGSLEMIFEERGFAVAILFLMFIPALPLPTGGVTHVFELIVMLLSLEMIVGMKTLWLPKSWRKKEFGEMFQKKTIPFMIDRIQWFEKFSRPRLRGLINNFYFTRLAGAIFFTLALSAFLAPPFSGLDTIPSLGAVVVALGLIFSDSLLFLFGCVVGVAGIGLVIAFGEITVNIFRYFF